MSTTDHVMGEDRRTFGANGEAEDTEFEIIASDTNKASAKFDASGRAEIKLPADVSVGTIVTRKIGDKMDKLRIIATTSSPVATDPDPDPDDAAVVVAPDAATPALDPRIDELDSDLEALEDKVRAIEDAAKKSEELRVRTDKSVDQVWRVVKWALLVLLIAAFGAFGAYKYNEHKRSDEPVVMSHEEAMQLLLTTAKQLDSVTSRIVDDRARDNAILYQVADLFAGMAKQLAELVNPPKPVVVLPATGGPTGGSVKNPICGVTGCTNNDPDPSTHGH